MTFPQDSSSGQTQPKRPVDVHEVRPRKDRRGVDLISDALPFRGLWYGRPNAITNAVDYAKFRSRSHHAVVSVYEVRWTEKRSREDWHDHESVIC